MRYDKGKQTCGIDRSASSTIQSTLCSGSCGSLGSQEGLISIVQGRKKNNFIYTALQPSRVNCVQKNCFAKKSYFRK